MTGFPAIDQRHAAASSLEVEGGHYTSNSRTNYHGMCRDGHCQLTIAQQ